MNVSKKWLIAGTIALAIVTCVGLVVAAAADDDRDVDFPLKIDLTLASLPSVGQPVQINATVSARVDAPNTSVDVALPDGIRLVGGDLTWNGDLRTGQSASISAQIVFDREGEYEITASAHSPIDEYNARLGEGAIAVHLTHGASARGLTVGDYSTPPLQLKLVLTGAEPAEPPAEGATAEPASPSGCGTVRAYGWAYYRNASDTAWIPAQNIAVELWDSDSWSGDDHQGTAITDANGYWSVGPVSQDDEWWTCGLDLYNLFAYDAGWGRVENGSGNRYTWKSGTISNVSNGTYSFGSGGIGYSLEEYRARNIFFTIRRAWLAVINRAHVPAAKAYIQYRHGDNSNQTWPHFSHGSQKIYLPGVGQDWSNYGKQKTILHELGHHYHWELYGDWLPTSYCPSPHYVDGASHDNCAWLEGWSTFFALFVNDPDGDRTAYGYNYESLPACASMACGSNVEGRVTGSLWDLYDTNNEGPQDVYTAGLNSSGRNKIFDVVDTGGRHDRFWDFWVAYRNRYGKFSAGHDSCRGVRAIRQNNTDGALGGDIWFNEWVDMADIPTQNMVRNTTKYIDLWAYANDYECSDGDLTYVIDYVSNSSVGASVTSGGYVKLQPATNWTGWSQIRVWAGDGLMWDYDYFWVQVTYSATDIAELAPPDAEGVNEDPPPGTPMPLITPTPAPVTEEPTYTPQPPPSTDEPTATPIGIATDTPAPTATPTIEVPPGETPGTEPTALPTPTATYTPTPVPTSFEPTPTPTVPTLSLSPNVLSLKQHETAALTALDGAPPYTWNATGGTINPQGADAASYQAGAERGEFVVTVRDSTGREAVADIVVGGLEITTKPLGRSTHINVGDTIEFRVDDLSAATRGPFLWILDGTLPTSPVGVIQAQAGGEEAIFTALGNGTALVTAYGTDPNGQIVNSNSILIIVGNTLEIPDVKGIAGQQATVRINLNNIVIRPMSSLEMTLLYPSGLLSFKSVEPTFRSLNFTIGSFVPTPGKLRIIMTSLTGEAIQPGRGPVLDIMFDVQGTAEAVPASNSAEDPAAVNLDFEPGSVVILDNQVPPQEIPVQTTGGNFTAVTGSQLPHDGDVDRNGRLNVRDLTLAIQIFLGRYAPSAEEFAAADIAPTTAGDGQVNVTDVLKIFNKALGKVAAFFGLNADAPVAAAGSAEVRLPRRITAGAGEELLLPIALYNTAAVGGIDVTLIYSPTLEVGAPTLALPQRSSHMISVINTDTARHSKAMLYSPDTVRVISTGQGEVLTLSFGVVPKAIAVDIGVIGATLSDVNGNAMASKLTLYDPSRPSDDVNKGVVYLPVILK